VNHALKLGQAVGVEVGQGGQRVHREQQFLGLFGRHVQHFDGDLGVAQLLAAQVAVDQRQSHLRS
jgi:hypothetical protein